MAPKKNAEKAAAADKENEAAMSKNATKKAQAQKSKDDLRMLEGEQAEAKKQRIKDRFFKVLIVGYFMQKTEDQEDASGKDVKAKKKVSSSGKKGDGESRSVKSMLDQYSGLLMTLAFLFFIIAGRMAEEGYNPDNRADGDNFYDVMGIARGSDMMEVRKAYKKLALDWHPDKNPECEACPAKFAKISEAYEVLGDNEKKTAYDQRRASKGSLESRDSVELTSEDFEYLVKRSNDAWLVQVYDPNDGLCKHFHPVWEDVARKYQNVAKFGRIDSATQRKALALLPQRIRHSGPVVFRFARGQEPEIFVWSGNAETSEVFENFIHTSFPQMHALEDAGSLKKWWGRNDRPRIIVAGPYSSIRKRGMRRAILSVTREAHVWSEFIDFAITEPKIAREALGNDVATLGEWSATYRYKDSVETVKFNVEETPPDEKGEAYAALQPLLARGMSTMVPSTTVRNFQQLCGASTLGHVSRTYCLVLVDAANDAVVKDLKESSAQYAQELKEVAENADGDAQDSTETTFHVQPVQFSTGTSRWYWKPVAAGSGFHPLWSEVKHSRAFVLDVEGKRIAVWKHKDFKEMFQQIAYEDLKFTDLPDEISLPMALADPEVPLKQATMRVITQPIGGAIAYLLLACAVAGLPELELPYGAALMAGLSTLILVIWPYACRRVTMGFSCFLSSSFECQVLVGS